MPNIYIYEKYLLQRFLHKLYWRPTEDRSLSMSEMDCMLVGLLRYTWKLQQYFSEILFVAKPDNTNAAMDDHADTAKENSSKSRPVASLNKS